ncbi:DDE-type integrase/transposase/recombinase [Cupriavidus sp. IK-TO18]|uniref:integrase catalytic domain-containing protein n=1 Tax=Cupriavidus sp. IK-TO18 TaxID=2782182 RepID=UPI001897F0E3|nr:DDE-type integrase/transposase/recombinase [Cupriavidus sp. IK-TO18]MBF6986500.1 transposase family protein [Cupriavidus sp. IK-TO18]
MPTESRQPEFSAVATFDYDKETLEFYCQPPTQHIPQTIFRKVATRDGIVNKTYQSTLSCTPDILRITEAGFFLYECKTPSGMEQLGREQPLRYARDAYGRWHCPEVEQYFAYLGLNYCICTSDEFNQQLVSNVGFLKTYREAHASAVSDRAWAALQKAFGQAPVLSLFDLTLLAARPDFAVRDVEGQFCLPDGFMMDDVYKAIADNQLFVDLENDDLSDLHQAFVCRSVEHLELLRLARPASYLTEHYVDSCVKENTELIFGGVRRIARWVTETHLFLTSGPGDFVPMTKQELARHIEQGTIKVVAPAHPLGEFARERVASLSESDIAGARKRRQYALTTPKGEASEEFSARSLQRYRNAVANAGESEFEQIFALAAKPRPGNRTRRIAQDVIDLIAEIAKEENNPTNPLTSFSYHKRFLVECQKRGLYACSLVTYGKEYVKHVSISLRQGARVAYNREPAVLYLHAEVKLHGCLPFDHVHMDHTKLDVLVTIIGRDGLPRRLRPWLSIAMDAESRAVLGFYLSIHAPSAVSCMMLCRDIVRRYKRMPAMVIVDNGKEFHSIAFLLLLDATNTDCRYRPPHQSRFGAVCERLFGTANTQLIHDIVGNTKAMQFVRTVTRATNPINADAPTLPQLHGLLDYYFFNIYGLARHPAHDDAPVRYLERRFNETGWRMNRIVPYDDRFRILTCVPPVKQPTRIIDSQRGIKIGHLYYWCDDFADKSLNGETVQVRMDVWNAAIAYVEIRKRHWVLCICKLLGVLGKVTQIELRYQMEQLRAGTKRGRGAVTEEELARVIEFNALPRNASVAEPKDFDINRLYDQLGMGATEDLKIEKTPLDTSAPLEPTATAGSGKEELKLDFGDWKDKPPLETF